MSNLTEILTALKHGTDNIAHDICAKHGYKTPYEIHFKNLDEYNPPSDIIISAGNPVDITMSQTFVLWCLVYEKKYIFRRKISAALEHMHHVHRTLRHPVPIDKAYALRKDAMNWVKTVAPDLPRNIDVRYLDVSFSVTVEDKISHMSLTLHGNDPELIKNEAINRLSNQVYENYDYEDMHEKLKEIQLARSKRILPAKIVIDDSTQAVNTKMEY